MDKKNRLYALAEEMELIKKQIEEGKKENKKIKFSTFGKRTLQIFKIGVAIVIVPVTSSGVIMACGWNPYKLNEKEKNTCIVSCIDSQGNNSKYETNTEYQDDYFDTVKYYDKWTKLDNGSYTRNIYTYKVKSDSLLTLAGIFQTSENVSKESLKELITDSLIKEIEIKELLTKEQLEKSPYIIGTYYDINKEKTILVKETNDEHNNTLLAFILVNILLMLIEFIILKTSTYFFENIFSSFTDSIYQIDIEELQKKLEKVTNEMQDEIINKQNPKKYHL